MKTDLHRVNLDELIRMFTELGLEKSKIQRDYYENIEDQTKDYNDLMFRMVPVEQEIAARGRDAEARLLPLLEHPDRWLRLSVAEHIVIFDEEKARAAVARIIAEAHKFDSIGPSARITLMHWDEGRKGLAPVQNLWLIDPDNKPEESK